MSAAVASRKGSVRSVFGCWTCRLRRKKCDENQPTCSACIALELQCDGYGDKPIWMDNGPLQRDQALKVKQIVGRTNSKRRKQQMLHSSPTLPENNMDIEMEFEETVESFDATSKYLLGKASIGGTGWHTEDQRKMDQIYGNTGLDFLEKATWSPTSLELPFLAESFSNGPTWESNLPAQNDFSIGHNRIPPTCTGPSQDSRTISASTLDPSTVREKGGVRVYGKPLEGIHLGADGASTSDWPWSSYQTDVRSLNSREFTQGLATVSNRPEDSDLRAELEDRLFMHYLDEVFYIQYPFYKSSFTQSRSWLYSSLKRAKSVYYTTLALSERHIRSTADEFLLPTSTDETNYYHTAVREMELSSMTTDSPGHTVDRLTYILQALWYELFAGGTGNWRSNILTAATVISPHVPARMRSNCPSKFPGSTTLEYNSRQSSERNSLFRDDTGSRVLLGSFMYFDIMACASTRSQPTLGLEHKRILETFDIDLGSLFGCANQIMNLILEIALLDNWKREAEQNRQLSMVELVKRGARIEENLQQEIGDLESMVSPGESDLEATSGKSAVPSQNESTNIFALSARTYLHVVISGAQPELPEIAKSVSKTIAAFKCLNDPRSVRNLVWPLCVSGCLALEGQRSFFRDLISKAEVTSSSVGTCQQAFQIIEKCWEMRNTCSYNCDWAFVMNKLGFNILLI